MDIVEFIVDREFTHARVGRTLIECDAELAKRYSEVNSENNFVVLPDGRLHMTLRTGSGYPIYHSYSHDEGVTWTKPTMIDHRVVGVQGQQLVLHDGSICLGSGRPGMFVQFDPTGTGEHYDIENRINLWEGEKLTWETDTPFRSKRMDLMYSCIPSGDYSWFTDDEEAYRKMFFKSWENVLMTRVGKRILVTYDLHNYIAEPGAEPVLAIRGVFLENDDYKD